MEGRGGCGWLGRWGKGAEGDVVGCIECITLYGKGGYVCSVWGAFHYIVVCK